MFRMTVPLLLSVFLVTAGCDSDKADEPPPPPVPAPAAPPEETKPDPPKVELLEPKDPNEACGQIILSAYRGAKFAADGVKRDKAAAKARAEQLLGKVKAGENFTGLALDESDAPSSAPRGGIMGTFTRSDWPEIHAAMEDPLFGLKVNQVSDTVVEADYGFLVVRRCPVEKAHGRHILVRYAGAKRADKAVKRSKAEAQALAQKLHEQIEGGGDFAKLAKAQSEDGSGKRGGDIGSPGRGRLALPFEKALFALEAGKLAPVVETEFGFHVVERLADE